jgi:hypothetical protein
LALTPDQSDALIREVDDAVREDRIFSFWKHYGKAVAILVVVALAAFGGWLLWQSYRNGQAEANSEAFAALLKTAQGAQLDQPHYDRLVKASGGYKTEAELVKAALAAGKNDEPGMLAAYDAIVADDNAPKPLRDLALVRRTAHNFDKMKPAEVIEALKDLAVPGNAWFGSAGEMVAIAYLGQNKKKEAGEMFASMSRDPVVTETIRQRAGQMAGALGIAPERIGNIGDGKEANANGQ